MPSTLIEVQALCDRYGLDVLDIQRIDAEWSIALVDTEGEPSERAYAEAVAGLGGGSTVGEAVREALASTALSGGEVGGRAAS